MRKITYFVHKILDDIAEAWPLVYEKIVGILIFMSMKSSILGLSEPEKS